MKAFFSIAEILSARCPDLPGSHRSLARLAAGWRGQERLARKRPGRAGEWEYHLSLLPEAAQARMLVVYGCGDDDGTVNELQSEALWRRFEGLSKQQKKACQRRLDVVLAVERYQAAGLGKTAAAERAAKGHHGISTATVFNWLKLVSGKPRSDWLAALAPAYRATAKRADCPPEAWAALRSDYLRPDRPGFSACYRRVAEAAQRHGWGKLPSQRALRRRLAAEVPHGVMVLARDGREKAKALHPPQRRDRSSLHAMQAVNIDGHEFDVWVAEGNGKPFRPIFVSSQDLHTGKLLAWRLSRTENKDVVRLVIGDMVERHGIPEKVVLDNGRAFASKMISGGAPTRFRNKIRSDDPKGLLTTLGIEIVWAKPRSGQSKPIERAFRDLTDDISRHPFCAGAYTGNSPLNKPENAGSRILDLEEFRQHVAKRIAEHNARPGRTSKVCAGRSFDEAFEASLADPGTLIKWPTAAQRSLWLLAAEQVTCRRPSGELHLLGNRYWSDELLQHIGHKVTVRFDPDNLHKKLMVYDLDESFVCEAACVEDAGFFSTTDARETKRKLRAFNNALAEQKRLAAELSPRQLADLYDNGRPFEEPAPQPAKVVRLAVGGPPDGKAAPADGDGLTVEQFNDFFGRAMEAVAENENFGVNDAEKKSDGVAARRKLKNR